MGRLLDIRFAQSLTDSLGGAWYTLKQLRGEDLYQRVRAKMKGK